MKKIFLLISLSVMGCSSTHGNKTIARATQETVASKIEVGISTKETVKSVYGSPIGVTFTDSGNEIWRYVFEKNRVKGSTFIPVVGIFTGGVNSKVKELVVFFGDDGIVKKFSFQDSAVTTRSGL